MRLRLMTYNIQIGVGIAQNPHWDPAKFNLEAIAKVIEAARPDIAALQEVDRFRARSGHMDQVEWLSRRLGFAWHAYAPAYYSLEPSGPPSTFAHGEYGVALLSRLPIRAQFVHPLYRRAQLEAGEDPWDIEPRVALETVVELTSSTAVSPASASPGAAGATAQSTAEATAYVTVVCTHWATAQDQRLAQAEEIKRLAARSLFPAIIMGDLNCTPDSPEFQALTTDFDDALALAGVSPDRRLSWPSGTASRHAIDHVLLHPRADAVTGSGSGSGSSPGRAYGSDSSSASGSGSGSGSGTTPGPRTTPTTATPTTTPAHRWRWHVVSAQVIQDTSLASDHNPVLVEVQLSRL